MMSPPADMATAGPLRNVPAGIGVNPCHEEPILVDGVAGALATAGLPNRPCPREQRLVEY